MFKLRQTRFSTKLMSPKSIVLIGVFVLLIAFIGYQAWHEYQIYRINKMAESFPTAAGTAAEVQREQAKNQTMALAKLMADYRRADKSNKTKHLNQVVALAEERQALLAELAQTDPAAAVRAVLPASVRKGMPDEVLAMLTEKQELKGELEVLYEDYEDHSLSRLRHVLKTANSRVELHLPKNAKTNALQTGTKVQARGWLFKHGGETIDSLAVNDEQNSLTVLAQDSTTTTATASTTTAALTNTLGEQRTLVMLVNFQDNTQKPWTVEETREMIFGTVNDFYKENSNDQTWLSGDVHGYNALPLDSTTCDYIGIDNYARQAAENDGIDVNSYNRRVYIFPKISGCLWSGMGILGGTAGTQTIAWINGSFTLNTIGHELGHNFGLHHAQKLDCGSETVGDNCVSTTYGDTMDIMGEAGVEGHFGAFNKEQLGWLSPLSGEIVTADSDGSYIIEPYESIPGGAAKGLKVRRGTDAVTGQPLWYYLEYRQAQGFDSFLDGKSGITDGVVFRLATESDIQSSQLLDMTPSSAWFDMDDAALLAGNSYSDSDAGVTITTEWADSSGASVNVSYSGLSCIRANPVLSLSPNESAWVVAGTAVMYSATVTSNDSAECSASNYDITAAVPSGWVSSNQSLNLAPGVSGTVILNVASADTAADGFYDLTIRAENSSDSNYSSSGMVSYVVDTPAPACVVANPLLSLINSQGGEVTAGNTVTYTATLTNQNSGSCAVADFNIAASVPAGWSADSSTVTLTPGDTASVNLNVTSASIAADGEYPIGINAFNTADIRYSSNIMASYTVLAPAPICVAAAPLLTLSASAGNVIAGSTVNYSATVTNQDSSDCATTDFAVSADVPAGWSASNPSVNLAPSASTTITLSVTSNSTATDDLYNIIIHAENAANSSYSNSAMVSYAMLPL